VASTITVTIAGVSTIALLWL